MRHIIEKNKRMHNIYASGQLTFRAIFYKIVNIEAMNMFGTRLRHGHFNERL